MTMPRAQVAAPPARPYAFGLQSAVIPRDDTRWESAGVTWTPETCGAGGGGAYWLNQDCTPPADRVNQRKEYADYDCPPPVETVPFTIYHSASRSGNPFDDVKARLQNEFAAVEPVLVEQAFWNGQGGEAAPNLVSSAQAAPFGETAAGIVTALAYLENGYHAQASQEGVIHAPRWVYPFAAGAGLAIRDRNQLRTPGGAVWAFGVGYNAQVAPGWATATATGLQSWMYMTGPVYQWRTEAVVNPPDIGSALNRATNDIELVIERTYVLAFECAAVAVLADLAPAAAGGGGGGGF